MAYKDNLRQASFRGVEFFIETSQFTGGRRVQNHEFVDRDIPFAEDLGRASKSFKVEGYLIGEDDIWDQRRALINAVETKGPGELIHPYFGTLQVQLGAFSIDENIREARIAKISFQFLEAGRVESPIGVNDPLAQTELQADATLVDVQDNLEENFSITGQPGFVVDSARAEVERLADLFTDSTAGITQSIDDVSQLAFSINSLKNESVLLLQSPANLANRFLVSFDLLESAIEAPPTDPLAVYSKFFESTPDVTSSSVDTPERQREIQNSKILNNFVVQAAVVKATLQAIQVEFESVQDAEKVKNELLEVIDSQLTQVESDEVFFSLTKLATKLVEVLPSLDGDLPSLQNITLENTTPSLVLAYDLFENRESELDLVERNNIDHPGFIEPGVELEVLNVRNDT